MDVRGVGGCRQLLKLASRGEEGEGDGGERRAEYGQGGKVSRVLEGRC